MTRHPLLRCLRTTLITTYLVSCGVFAARPVASAQEIRLHAPATGNCSCVCTEHRLWLSHMFLTRQECMTEWVVAPTASQNAAPPPAVPATCFVGNACTP